ncbi:MAG TPA: chemotaxis protein CheW [Acetobacteraceae bacterium]|nr:chemotaxis protein CheW [Acetobacteraceae bacterium]
MDELIVDFLSETNESIAELDVALVRLERTPDDQATLSSIFRLVHTIKGTCGFLGLPRLERVAHSAENVLGKVRDGALTATPDTVTLVLTALDRIKAIVAGLAASGNEPAGDDGELVEALNATAAGEGPKAATPAPAPIVAESVPEARQSEPVTTNQTIRVNVDVLEDLMTLVSELVLTRNQLFQLARTQENVGFAVPLQRLSHITSDLQEGVMKTRMQPIGNAWNKLPRLVRDLSREMDKQIELTMLGADIELDRQVLELIRDPLTHLVRNSGDHGLETPAERRAAGKPETGHITLNAFHEGGHIIIEIADEGRGLPLDKIRAKILNNGLATEAELAGMTDAQLQRFIFRRGFSTATVVTAVSGRGVGLDVVKTNIEKFGGTIDLKSVPGAGTTFTIKIPLTLAIVSALIVEAGGERFAIPQTSVVELVRAQKAGRGHNAAGSESVVERINDTPVLRLCDRLLPLVNLTDLLAMGESHNDDTGAYIVVAQVGANSLGIIVDRVFDIEEIVVKPVAPILRHITMFSGNTILGDGSVIMILDPNGIARATGIGAGGDSKAMSSSAMDAQHSTDRTAMLLFRAESEQKLAVPLGLVARLEDIPREQIELSCGAPVTQYRGKLMPLVALSDHLDAAKPRQPVLVFNDGDRSMGLMVDAIVDVVEDRLNIELSGARPGWLGSAVIAGFATDVIDTGYWLTQAWQDWFHGSAQSAMTQGERA